MPRNFRESAVSIGWTKVVSCLTSIEPQSDPNEALRLSTMLRQSRLRRSIALSVVAFRGTDQRIPNTCKAGWRIHFSQPTGSAADGVVSA